MTQDEIFNEIIEIEKKYEENNYNGIKNSLHNYKIIDGNIPVLLSSPHSVKQMRNNNEKSEEKLTGALTEYICMKTNAYGIVRLYNSFDDPNYENEGIGLEYKNEIIKLVKNKNIKYLIDIHGCQDIYDFDIDIGTNDGMNITTAKNELNFIQKQLSNIGIVSIDNIFKASNNVTISNYIHSKLGIPCFQLELSQKVRYEETKKLLDDLEIIIKSLIKK